MSFVTVSNKGQVVIPADVRKAQIELRHPATVSTHEAGEGMLKYRGPARQLADADVADLMRRANKLPPVRVP